MRHLVCAFLLFLAVSGHASQAPAIASAEALTDALAGAASHQERMQLVSTYPQLATIELAERLRNDGLAWWKKGEYPRALPLLESAAVIARARGATHLLASTLNNLGAVHGSQGNYAESLAQLQQSLAFWEELRDEERIATVTLNIGNIYRWQRNFEQALTAQRRVLEFARRRQDTALASAAGINIGFIQLELGDLAAARTAFESVVALGESIGAQRMATSLEGLGDIQTRERKFSEAAASYQRALEHHRSAGDRAGLARSLGSLAWVHHLQHDDASAIRAGREALEIAGALGVRETIWRIANTVGRAERNLKNYDAARAAFEQAIATIEQMRSDLVGSEREQQRFFVDKIHPYHDMVDLLQRQGLEAEALDYAERSKARMLLDVSRSGRVRVQQAMTADERAEESRLRTALVRSLTAVQRVSGPGAGKAAVAQAQAERDRARLEYGRFETGLYARHPELRIKRGEAEWPGAGPAAALIGPDAALIEYVVSEERTHLIVLTRQPDGAPQVRSWVIPIGFAALRSRIVEFRGKLARRDLAFRRDAADLYDVLIRPWAAALGGKKTLIVVPDGILWQMPFQALYDGKRYLIEKHAILAAPSMTVLAEMSRVAQPGSAAPRLLAIGNPASRAGELPNAETEVQRIADLHGRARSLVITGAKALERTVKREMSRHDIVHLATHGRSDDKDPMASHVLLAAPAAGETDDGVLEARELMELELASRLVVLSACETALGQSNTGEGMIGLTWALFIAGNVTTVASQWQVDSESTTELMIALHRDVSKSPTTLRSSVAVARALQRAASELLRKPATAHPFYWAGFVTVGSRL